jgi:hypothetical protein
MKRLAFALLVALSACARTSAGSGTGNLYVEADIQGKPGSTKMSVIVKRQGNVVVGANVFLEDLDTGRTKNLEGRGDSDQKKGDYSYEGTWDGYVRAISLKITSGDAELEGALEGPSEHEITRPPDNFIVRRGDGSVLTVEWSVDARADRAVIDAEGIDPIEIEGDPGSAELPLDALPQGDQKVSVERETSVELQGGTEGSRIRARYKVDNRFTLER